jgi:hypothetical protein
MRAFLTLLSILGVLAVALRLGRSLLRAIGRSAEGVAAGQAVDARAQRGDLTGMAEATEWRRLAARRRWRALTTSGMWAALLVGPAYTSWTLPIYAAYALLWVWDLIARRVG